MALIVKLNKKAVQIEFNREELTELYEATKNTDVISRHTERLLEVALEAMGGHQ